MISTAYHLRELEKPVGVPLSTLGYREFTSHPDWKRNLISFTSLQYHAKRNSVFCGLTAFDNDLMYEFSLADKTFRSLNFADYAEKFEIKIHRSLHLCKDGSLIGATACLHREDQMKEGRGGRIFRYDPDQDHYDFLGIPFEHNYIQTITVDEERQLVYGFTYPIFAFFVFSLQQRKLLRLDYMGSIPHIVSLDRAGRFWATWNCRTHNLFCYDPEQDDIRFFYHALPQTVQSCNLMYPGAGPIDSMILGNDGMLYIGEAAGNLDRLDPTTGQVVDLGQPVPGETRIPALALGNNGTIYGIAGFLEKCHMFAYNPVEEKFTILGHIHDEKSGIPLFIGHDITLIDEHRAFVGETDTANRAGYLWECQF
ncbi:MAG: PQQ-like beta-propeller repeat protein [Lentisphaerae bacterium]|nr:PQQ-like beta-propeller repeat protein [Lentisphaerota bacterium]